MPRDVTREQVQPRFRTAPLLPAPQPLSPLEALRQILGNGDILGRDPEGNVWLLLSADSRLFDFLMHFESEIEDAEESDFTIEQNSRMVHEEDEDDGSAEDIGDFEPDFRDNPPVLLGGAS